MNALSEDLDRRDQLLAAAEQLVLAKSSLAITLNEIADEIGVSRSLLYVYFDSVPQIIDELFLRQAQAMEAFMRSDAYRRDAFRERVQVLFDHYLTHLIEQGPLILLVLRERNQDSPLGEESRKLFRKLLSRLAHDVSASLTLSAREAFVLLELLFAIPESLARMVRAGSLDRATARATTERLVTAALDALVVRAG